MYVYSQEIFVYVLLIVTNNKFISTYIHIVYDTVVNFCYWWPQNQNFSLLQSVENCKLPAKVYPISCLTSELRTLAINWCLDPFGTLKCTIYGACGPWYSRVPLFNLTQVFVAQSALSINLSLLLQDVQVPPLLRIRVGCVINLSQSRGS